MLTPLLPGVREVRTPVASGFAWLLVGWLVLAGHLPRSRPAQHVFATLWDLGTYVGKGGLLVVVSFAAYLIGAFLEVDPMHLWEHGGRPRWINHLRDVARRGRFHHSGIYPLSDQTRRDLHDFTAEGYRFDSAQDPLLYLPAGIMREERHLAARLQAANVELYNRYDRARLAPAPHPRPAGRRDPEPVTRVIEAGTRVTGDGTREIRLPPREFRLGSRG